MDIRRLVPADAADFRALRLRALWDHPDAFTSSYEEDEQEPIETVQLRLGRPDTTFWGAYDEGQLCGMVGLEREARAKCRHKARLVMMYVAPEFTGRGIGRTLVQAAARQAREEGLEVLLLTLTEGDGPARKLYERAGFRSFGVEPRAIRVDGRFYAKDHMVLELSPS